MISHINKLESTRIFFYIIIIFLLILNSCATTNEDKKVEQANAQYRLGLSKLRDGKLKDAFIQFNKTMELNPSDKRPYNALGLVYLYLEEYDNAERTFQKAIKIDPNFSEAYNNLGVIYTRLRLWDKSAKAFRKALENPFYESSEQAYYNLGMSLLRGGYYKEAIKEFINSTKRAPYFHLPYYGISLCYKALNQYGRAADALSMAIKIDPVFRGDTQKAQKYFKEGSLKVTGLEEKDFVDLLEILHY